MALLFTPGAQVYDLPIIIGEDLVVDFQNQDANGNPVDYAPGVALRLDIYLWAEGIMSAQAQISTNHAVCFLPHSRTDQIAQGVYWRCVLTVPGGLGTPASVDIVPVNGAVVLYGPDSAPAGAGSVPLTLPNGNVSILVPTPGPPGVSGIAGTGVSVFGEVPAGTPNGSTTVFTCANNFQSGSTRVYRNGLREERGLGYSESTPTIIFTTAPMGTDVITVDYLIA
ncbi:hypothetical protein BN000_00663 [Mycobacterium europaeum]|uniref:LtfC/p132/Gp6 beta-sandwich domain-containing protein n=1 Tax=Mycobacterium europaeum TaxID=761804 RepID=A0A0U1CZC8_9MYCO|nr:hypothetical protein [Mycobacterium europaeum]CQD03842.1 hypothetical protein BN000_00663 [Mycobacterium europaeum]